MQTVSREKLPPS